MLTVEEIEDILRVGHETPGARIVFARRAALASARQARASASVLKLLRIVLRSRGEKTWAW